MPTGIRTCQVWGSQTQRLISADEDSLPGDDNLTSCSWDVIIIITNSIINRYELTC